MKRLSVNPLSHVAPTIWDELLTGGIPNSKASALQIIQQNLITADQKTFYPLTVKVLMSLGYNAIEGNHGDTSNRVDAFIKDASYSIPIEIKSPTEVLNINIKSVQQAVENKVILLSRQFYPTTLETSSLAIGYLYPEERSGVYELIDDVKYTYGFNIGIITLHDLIVALWERDFEATVFNKSRITNLKGKYI
ncbi:hypothetical protein ACFPMF_27765 [Larkinella bovis]|uniref:Restriction endonuclease n=1 Tax=Larkinella bovis TaxID=683041 RepID=A0ABW0ILB2_9BACT